MARCKVQAQKCRFIETELEERLIEQLFIGTRDWKVQEVLLGKNEKLKLDREMDTTRTKAVSLAAVLFLVTERFYHKSLLGKDVQPQAQDAGSVISGITGSKCAKKKTNAGSCNQSIPSQTT